MEKIYKSEEEFLNDYNSDNFEKLSILKIKWKGIS